MTDVAFGSTHTMPRPEVPDAAFDKLCQEALAYRFYGVRENPAGAYVAKKLQGTGERLLGGGIPPGFDDHPLEGIREHARLFPTRLGDRHGDQRGVAEVG